MLLEYLGVIPADTLLDGICKAAIYFPYCYLAATPKADIRKTVDASFFVSFVCINAY